MIRTGKLRLGDDATPRPMRSRVAGGSLPRGGPAAKRANGPIGETDDVSSVRRRLAAADGVSLPESC